MVAHGMMPLTAALLKTTPFVTLMVPVGLTMFIVAPAERVMAPSERSNGLVAAAVSVSVALPLASAVLAKVWLFVVLALPVSVRLPPESESVPAAARMFVAGVDEAKSRLRTPSFKFVAPV